MRTLNRVSLTALVLLGIFLLTRPGAVYSGVEAGDGVMLTLVGRVVNTQGAAVSEAEVRVFIDDVQQTLLLAGEETEAVHSDAEGFYVAELTLASSLAGSETLTVEIGRPGLRTQHYNFAHHEMACSDSHCLARIPDIVLPNVFNAAFFIATITFVGILLLIALEKLHSTMAALLGVAVLLGTSFVGGAISSDLFIFDFERALQYVDFDVIFLVMGMMIVIGVIEGTGIFQWLAYQAYRLSRGRAWLLVTVLMVITSVASALLDNVTTMLLMTPMTLQIALALGINPLSLLLPEVLASNVGGISTLIGTPTNILIGSYAGISFNDFLSNLTPGVLLAQVLLTVYVLVIHRKEYASVSGGLSPALLERLKENARITEPVKLRRAGVVFVGMLLLFVLGERIHLVPAVTAILGSVAMLMVVESDVEEMLKVVDWTTLMFFIALFMVVGAIQEVGLISLIATGIKAVVGENLTVAMLVLIWAGALLSGVIANIPFTAAMLPVVGFLTRAVPGAGSKVLFYGLSVGSAMGGNSSLIGASANLVTAGIAERAGYPITYMKFLKIGFPAMIITVAVGTIWLFIRF